MAQVEKESATSKKRETRDDAHLTTILGNMKGDQLRAFAKELPKPVSANRPVHPVTHAPHLKAKGRSADPRHARLMHRLTPPDPAREARKRQVQAALCSAHNHAIPGHPNMCPKPAGTPAWAQPPGSKPGGKP
jgi:hypothetical protein